MIKGATPKEIRKIAKDWVSKNMRTPVQTEIGDVAITPSCIENSLNHGAGKEKLDTIPLIDSVLKNGVYMGNAKDMDGKSIKNHYFAGKIKIDGNENILFCRVREASGDPLKKRMYVHEIFTDEDIKKNALITGSSQKIDTGLRGRSLYSNLIYKYLNVNQTGDHAPTLVDLFEMIKRPA